MQLVDEGVDVASLAMALAIPGSRPRLYKTNGSNSFSDEWCGSIPEAVASGRPFVIALRDAVVAIDFDPDEVHRGALDSALMTFDEEGLAYIRAASGRPGHEHVFVILPAWQRPDRFDARLREEFGIPATAIRWTGRGTFMRPPLSPHRYGLDVTLLHPPTIEAAIDLATPRLDLPAATKRILDVDQYSTAEPNRSKLKARVMTGAVAGDICFEFVRDSIWNDPGPIGDKVREQGYDDIERSWRIFQDHVAKNPPKKPGYVAATLQRIQGAAMVFDAWRPQTLHNDRAALWALCETARIAGSLEFTAARRTLALRAGVEAKTLAQSLARLEQFGFVEVLSDASLQSDRGSFRYRLCDPSDHLTPDKGLLLLLEREVYWRQVGPAHDAFAPRALGKQGWLIIVSMPEMGADAGSIASRCGYTSSISTLKHLRRMARAGVVESDDAGIWRVSPDLDLDHVALQFGTHGRSEVMRSRYESERARDVASRTVWGLTARQPA